ncbi:FAD binding domain-containing protein [Chloroflexota bacterium]
MYRVLKPFEFLEPETIAESVRLLFMHGAKARVMAGGVDLLLKMRLRQLQPEYVVSIRKVSGLDYLEGDPKTGLRFGAMCSLRSLEQSSLVQQSWALLYEAIHRIASVPTKSMGTAVGNICVATPASDVSLALIALGAEASVVGFPATRVIPVENLFLSAGKTVLEPDEIVAGIYIPPLPEGADTAFMKLTKTADDIAKVNVAVAIDLKGGKCHKARIVLGSVAATPVRAIEAEDSLTSQKVDSKSIVKAAELAAASVRPITDVRSTADYRSRMVHVLVKDALEKACGIAGGQL